MFTWIVIVLCFWGTVNGVFITVPDVSSAWNLSQPQTIQWRREPGDPHRVDIYALWWNSTRSQTYAPLALNVSTRIGNWTGRAPPQVPSNYFITVRMMTSGHKPPGNVSFNFIQDDSPEFITFNNNSTVRSLPNNGIRMAVPTPSNTAPVVTQIIFSTITTTETATQTAEVPESSNTKPIIVGVAGSIGGMLIGGLAAALLFALLRRPKNDQSSRYGQLRISEPMASNVRDSFNRDQRPSAVSGPGNIFTREGPLDNESPSIATFRTDEISERRSTASPQLLGRWTGRTVYQKVANPTPDGSGYPGPRRIATLDFRNVRS